MRYCPECTIKTELLTYEVNGVRGERCIPCKKMWILETTFARGLGDLDTVLKEVGKSKFQCPDCRGLFYRYEVQRHQNFNIEKCNQCDSVWMPVGAVKAFMELEPVHSVIQETITLGEEQNLKQILINDTFHIPDIEDNVDDSKTVVEKKNSNLSLIFLIIMLLCIKVPIKDFGFFSFDPFRMAGLTIISYAFLHADLIHFLGNAIFYAMFSYRIEGRIGSEGFLTLFVLSSTFSVLVHSMLSERVFVLIGASGAITGMMTYYALAFPKTKVVQRDYSFTFRNWYTSRQTITFYMLGMLGLNFLYLSESHSNIAYAGHLGGALGGFIYYLLGQRPEFKKK